MGTRSQRGVRVTALVVLDSQLRTVDLQSIDLVESADARRIV